MIDGIIKIAVIYFFACSVYSQTKEQKFADIYNELQKITLLLKQTQETAQKNSTLLKGLLHKDKVEQKKLAQKWQEQQKKWLRELKSNASALEQQKAQNQALLKQLIAQKNALRKQKDIIKKQKIQLEDEKVFHKMLEEQYQRIYSKFKNKKNIRHMNVFYEIIKKSFFIYEITLKKRGVIAICSPHGHTKSKMVKTQKELIEFFNNEIPQFIVKNKSIFVLFVEPKANLAHYRWTKKKLMELDVAFGEHVIE